MLFLLLVAENARAVAASGTQNTGFRLRSVPGTEQQERSWCYAGFVLECLEHSATWVPTTATRTSRRAGNALERSRCGLSKDCRLYLIPRSQQQILKTTRHDNRTADNVGANKSGIVTHCERVGAGAIDCACLLNSPAFKNRWAFMFTRASLKQTRYIAGTLLEFSAAVPRQFACRAANLSVPNPSLPLNRRYAQVRSGVWVPSRAPEFLDSAPLTGTNDPTFASARVTP